MSELSHKLQIARETMESKRERVEELKKDMVQQAQFPVARAKACGTTGLKEGHLYIKGTSKGIGCPIAVSLMIASGKGWSKYYCKFNRDLRTIQATACDVLVIRCRGNLTELHRNPLLLK